MFFGLFRLRFHKSWAFGMGRLLWRQVGCLCFFLAVVATFSLYVASYSQLKGLVWLLVALIADILPLVSGQFHVSVLSTYRHFSLQVFLCLNLNG